MASFESIRQQVGDFGYLFEKPLLVNIKQLLSVIRFVRQNGLRGIERGRSVMPPALYRRKHEILPATMRSLRLNSTGTLTLLHQDVHQGNWLRDPDGRMGLYDWQ